MKQRSRSIHIFLFIIVLFGIIYFLPETGKAQESTYTPWSGWWWPARYGGLATGLDYRGHPAPLEKYELLTLGKTGGDAVDYYKNILKYYNPNAVTWAGLCPYWARAAMLENYEILPSSEDNIVFRVGDKKGLLTLCHDSAAMTKVDGSDPVNLHMWLLSYINDQKVAFTADLDPGTEVWYYPIYKYEMTRQRSGMSQFVTVKVYFPSDNVPPDYMGIFEKLKIYTYTLTLNTGGEVVDGVWTGNSITDHPDMLAFPLSTNPKNPYLDAAEIRRIAKAKDDFLETTGNQPVAINPGTYHLVLLDEDQYVIDENPGDEVMLEIVKDDGSDENIDVELTDASGVSVTSRTLTKYAGEKSLTYRLEVQTPPYTLTLSQNNYYDPNIYTLMVDKRPAFQQHVPYIPKNGPWCGFAITNAGDTKVDDVMLVTGFKNGSPIQTVWGPLDLNPGEKQAVMFDDLPWRQHEYVDTNALYLIADSPVQFVNLFAADQKPMAGFMEGASHGTRLVIPDTYKGFSSARQMFGGVINESFTDAPATFRILSADGALISRFSQTIPAGGKIAIQPGIAPFGNMTDGGWIDITATTGHSLSAYEYVAKKTGGKDVIETQFAIPVGLKTKYVPHITASTGGWRTYLTLINVSSLVNPVNFHFVKAGADKSQDMNLSLGPFEKKVMNLSSEFSILESNALYRSVLKISGKYPIVGYYTFSAPNVGDEASYHLLDSNTLSAKLVLPSQAGDSASFWTKVGICNPGSGSVKVTMRPYDAAGLAISGAAKTISLGPGAYSVFTLSQKFGEDASRIAFIKFQSNSSSIGGYYLLGNMKDNRQSVEMLAGANMHE
jgi:hypothetical protein